MGAVRRGYGGEWEWVVLRELEVEEQLRAWLDWDGARGDGWIAKSYLS